MRLTNGANNGASISTKPNPSSSNQENKFSADGSLVLTSIGTFKSTQEHPYQAGRQPDQFGEAGKIMLKSGFNFEQALTDLEGVSHIWILFGFHHNSNWKPMVQTPRSDKKIGVFASRAPYRPNPIGMSVVKLISVDGLTLTVSEPDILNDSPIYDIKPYHPDSDLITEAEIGWIKKENLVQHQIRFSPLAEEQIDWLGLHGQKDMKAFIHRQLEYDPTNSDKKRVEEKEGYFCLSYRTWRIDFALVEHSIGIMGLRSGYSAEELKTFEDPYNDKSLHRSFIKNFES